MTMKGKPVNADQLQRVIIAIQQFDMTLAICVDELFWQAERHGFDVRRDGSGALLLGRNAEDDVQIEAAYHLVSDPCVVNDSD